MNKIPLISIIIFIYIFFALFGFQMFSFQSFTKSKLELTQRIFKFEKTFKNQKFLTHVQLTSNHFSFLKNLYNNIMYASVCTFGKFGLVILVLWSLTLIGLLNYYKGENRLKVIHILGWVNLSMAIIYSILSLIMNWPLFIRCVPFLILQYSISIWLTKLTIQDLI